VDEFESGPMQQHPHALHPSLLSFLHQQCGSTGAEEAQPGGGPGNLADGTANMEMQVLLVSPPSLFANTVADVLRNLDPTCRVTQAVQVSRDIMEGLRSPSLALIDLDASPANAEALIRQITQDSSTPVVALSASLDRTCIDRALDAGAVGYLPKTYARPLIEGVLRLIIGGERFRPHGEPRDARKRGRPMKFVEPHEKTPEEVSNLTPREKDVLLEVARGASNLDIGRRLDMKEGTVKTHLYAIYRKLNVRNRASAALFGARMSEIQQEQMTQAGEGKLNLSWLQPEMTHRRMKAGQWIFHQGDVGSELFYIQRGRVEFPEIEESVGPGEVFGEIGIFAPGHKRTSSARCETDVDLFSLSSGQVRRIYFGNPQFALFILTLVATRLADGRKGNGAQGA
jgi:two-component system, NarL family, nitrate/nitrite response regulator NarL